MAKNVEYIEESEVSPRPRRSRTSTESPIPFLSLKAGAIADGIEEFISFWGTELDESYGVFGAVHHYMDEYDKLYSISSIYTTYSKSREKDILVLKASSGATMSGTSIYDCLSSREYAGLPVYIEGKDRFIPIHGVGCNGVDVFLVVYQEEYQEPKPLYEGFMVRISQYYYKYNSSNVFLFTCSSFEAANHLLLRKYQEYKDQGYESETIPDATSNEWLGDDHMDTVHIVIRNLINDCPAECPQDYA